MGYFEKISESPTGSYYYSLSQQRVAMLVVVATAVGEAELLGGTGGRKAGIDANPDCSLVQKDCYGKSGEKEEKKQEEWSPNEREEKEILQSEWIVDYAVAEGVGIDERIADSVDSVAAAPTEQQEDHHAENS